MRWFIRNGNKDKIKKSICEYIDQVDEDCQVDIDKMSQKRTLAQNALQRTWMTQLAEQGDMTAEEYRAHTKLHVGVPILRAENEEFRRRYDEVIKPLPYATKLKLMAEPFDFPVTRLMTVEQKKRYLDEMARYWANKGFILTVQEK